jgi:hypothetical protein
MAAIKINRFRDGVGVEVLYDETERPDVDPASYAVALYRDILDELAMHNLTEGYKPDKEPARKRSAIAARKSGEKR